MLTADHFPAFFREMYGYEPFPWQTRLARSVIEDGQWPELLDLPTGAGKTAALDIAVFHLAVEAAKGPSRKAPVRILFVVDRRIIVDAAFERAKTLARKLEQSTGGILFDVARRLKFLAGSQARPLDIVRLRGGAPRERDWARSPAQPLVVVSTVDQVGSRLLFRGYGVSPRMRPVHAGLVGADALWLLDEVHLSRPLQQTLASIDAQHRSQKSDSGLWPVRLAPFGVVYLSATPDTGEARGAFRLSQEDLRDERLRRRLTARKFARLERAGEDMVADFATHALRITGLQQPQKPSRSHKGETEVREGWPHRVAVVVNRVHLARHVFSKIEEEVGDRARVLLLTGRVRPLDRDRILEDLQSVYAGADRSQPDKPIIVVATQTIEAGADLDFDALITEIAPLDALRQRFGRLDRLGQRQQSHAVILYPRGKPSARGNAPGNDWDAVGRIYGDGAYATLQWLQSLDPEIDFGIIAMDERLASLSEDERSRLLAPRPDAPVLLPPYAQLWAMTSPAPHATPEPSLFLHGPTRPPDVNVVWRADVAADGETPGPAIEHSPPTSLEALPLPIWTLRGWLSRIGAKRMASRQEFLAEDAADVPTEVLLTDDDADRGTVKVWRWRDGEWQLVSPDGIAPGDTVLLNASVGGCDGWGWNPESSSHVEDLGAEAHYLQRLRGCISVTRASITNFSKFAFGEDADMVADEVWREIVDLIRIHSDAMTGEAARLALLRLRYLPATWRRLLEGMENRDTAVQLFDPEEPERGFVLFARRQLEPGLLDAGADDSGEAPGPEAVSGYSDSSAGDSIVTLEQHLDEVARWTAFYAARAGLDDQHTHLVTLAARLHDLGKADPRFQADLRNLGSFYRHGAELLRALTAESELLAKSDQRLVAKNNARHRAAPKNFRHEALSVSLAKLHPKVKQLEEDERDLLFWLIGTHHGYGRPFFPPYSDPDPSTKVVVNIDGVELAVTAGDAPVRVDQGWFELWRRVLERYGPWELARLETIVRLADHAASAGRRAPDIAQADDSTVQRRASHE